MTRTTYFEDVEAFHEKFMLPQAADGAPTELTYGLLKFRGGFLLEELAEFFAAHGMTRAAGHLRDTIIMLRNDRFAIDGPTDLEAAADSLADLTYVALGTAHFMRVPFDDVWAEVQRANMAKERATGADDPRSKRAHASDVVKPAGWRAPDHGPAIRAAAERFRGRVG